MGMATTASLTSHINDSNRLLALTTDRDVESPLTSSSFLTTSTTQAAFVTTPSVLTAPISLPNVQLKINSSRFQRTAPITEESSQAASNLLPLRLLGDVLVATSVTFGVAPFVSIVDKAIVQRAFGTHSIIQSSLQSIKFMVTSPAAYVKSPMFLMMWGVYAATYTTANSLKTLAEHWENKCTAQAMEDESFLLTKTSTTDVRGMGKFGVIFGTTLVNSGSSMLKDRAYATMFTVASSPAATARSFPLITYGLWGARDCMVIGSSFVLPEIMSAKLQEIKPDMEKSNALRVSQLACPIATQFIAGPFQLLGLDFYNRPLTHLTSSQAALERIREVARKYVSIVGARIARIAPAYGIGGIGNTYLRDEWRSMLIRRETAIQLQSPDNEYRDRRRERATQLMKMVMDVEKKVMNTTGAATSLRKYRTSF